MLLRLTGRPGGPISPRVAPCRDGPAPPAWGCYMSDAECHPSSFADVLRELLQERGLGVPAFSQLSGIPKPTIHSYLLRRIPWPSPSTLERFIRAFDLAPGDAERLRARAAAYRQSESLSGIQAPRSCIQCGRVLQSKRKDA